MDKNDPEDFDNRRHSWEDNVETVIVKRHSEQWNNINNESSNNGIVLNPSSIIDEDRY